METFCRTRYPIHRYGNDGRRNASVGILQALADSGVVTLATAAIVLFGQNVRNINEEKLGVSAMSMEVVRLEFQRILHMADENVYLAFEAFTVRDEATVAEIDKCEEYIDYLNKEISKYISREIIR